MFGIYDAGEQKNNLRIACTMNIYTVVLNNLKNLY